MTNGWVGCGWRVSDATPLRPQLEEKAARWRSNKCEVSEIDLMVSEGESLLIRDDDNLCLPRAFIYLKSVRAVRPKWPNPELGFAHHATPPNPSSGYFSSLGLLYRSIRASPDFRKPLFNLVVIRCFPVKLPEMVDSMQLEGLR